MALQSMTGFARVDGSSDQASWTWEVRSVNGKGLDVRLRYPSGFDELESEFRKRPKSIFTRGNLQLNLSLDRGSTQSLPVINDEILDAVIVGLEKISARTNLPITSPEQILSIKGVMEYGEPEQEPDENKALHEFIISDLDKLLNELHASRSNEGSAISTFLTDQLDKIEALNLAIQNDPSRSITSIKARLSEQISRLIEESNSLDNDRLHQEAAILAAKADIREEIDRLSAHITSARELISAGGPVGRKLDFLSQEFNRECNTICSKSNASSVTALGLEMKITIDQFKEQIQNIE